MALSRKHYRAVADILQKANLQPEQRSHLVGRFGEMFKADNPRYQHDKFTTAATPTGPSHEHFAAGFHGARGTTSYREYEPARTSLARKNIAERERSARENWREPSALR